MQEQSLGIREVPVTPFPFTTFLELSIGCDKAGGRGGQTKRRGKRNFGNLIELQYALLMEPNDPAVRTAPGVPLKASFNMIIAENMMDKLYIAPRIIVGLLLMPVEAPFRCSTTVPGQTYFETMAFSSRDVLPTVNARLVQICALWINQKFSYREAHKHANSKAPSSLASLRRRGSRHNAPVEMRL